MPEVPPDGSGADPTEWLNETICELVNIFNRNCDELSKQLEERSVEVDDMSKQWTPNFPSEAVKEQFKRILEWLREGLQRFFASFPASVTTRLNAMVDRLEAQTA